MTSKPDDWQVGGSTYDLLRERDELRAKFNQYVRGAEIEASELRAAIRLALQYLTAGGHDFMATDKDGQAAVDTLLAALGNAKE